MSGPSSKDDGPAASQDNASVVCSLVDDPSTTKRLDEGQLVISYATLKLSQYGSRMPLETRNTLWATADE